MASSFGQYRRANAALMAATRGLWRSSRSSMARPLVTVTPSGDLFYIVVVMAGDYLGEFEHLVLLALLRLGDEAYGVTVRQEIAHRTKRDVSVGAIYATLARLETKGFVRSWVGTPTAARGGRAKRHFRVTAKGTAIVERTHTALRRMAEGLTLKGSLA